MKKIMLTTLGLIGVSMTAAVIVSASIYKLAKGEATDEEQFAKKTTNIIGIHIHKNKFKGGQNYGKARIQNTY